MSGIQNYSQGEEKLNIATHAFGLVLSIIGFIFLIIRAVRYGDAALQIVSFVGFGLSLVILYGASTIYHSAQEGKRRRRLRIFDHAAIYILIAGTYTPFALVTLESSVGWTLFAIAWTVALFGIVLKLFFTGKYDGLSTFMYIALGWLIVFFIKPLLASLPSVGIYWLVAGGVAYTVGAIIYSISALKYNHAIFHVFVLLGSFCHFVSVFFYVLPIR